jgi:Tol biopolymer transport system component
MARLTLPLFCLLALVSASSIGHASDRVLFDRIGPTQAALYVAQADGSGEYALLPSEALDYNPAWSPKGDWIAFTRSATARPTCIVCILMVRAWSG